MYRQLIGVYFVFGLYLAALTVWQRDLMPAVVCHALYNWAAILYVRHRFASGTDTSQS